MHTYIIHKQLNYSTIQYVVYSDCTPTRRESHIFSLKEVGKRDTMWFSRLSRAGLRFL